MAGIVSYGSYIPYRRLKRAAIAQVLGGPAVGKGERAVASFDEDSASMAVEAVRDAPRAPPPGNTGPLTFPTPRPPSAEKLNAPIVGAAALLPAEIRAVDLTGSVRAGISALLQGADAAATAVFVLARWVRDGVNPVARTNVCPAFEPPAAPALYAFSYPVPAAPAPVVATCQLFAAMAPLPVELSTMPVAPAPEVEMLALLLTVSRPSCVANRTP